MTEFEKDLEYIHSLGFDRMKVELEADLQRFENEDEYESRQCETCDEGRVDCTDCEGDGYNIGGDGGHNECYECVGDGYRTCYECDGNYEEEVTVQRFSDENCEDFMLENVPKDARDSLDYHRFYNDQSVDSELTLTIPTKKAKNHMEFIKAMKKLADHIGNGLDVKGAGMHITVFSGSRYPASPLPKAKIENFKKQVMKMMPALYFQASCDFRSRGLEFRYPGVSPNKYMDNTHAPAIHTNHDTCIEYRLFETCYDKPKAFEDYVHVIAKTLEYYADPTKEAPAQHKQFVMTNKGEGIGRFFDTPKKLDILEKQLAHTKPSKKSIVAMKKERHFDVTMEHLERKVQKRKAKMKADYAEHASFLKTQNDELQNKELTNAETVHLERAAGENGTNFAEEKRKFLGAKEIPTFAKWNRKQLNRAVARINV